MKNAFSIRTRLLLIVSGLCLLAALNSGSGLLGMSQIVQGMDSIYRDRVVPLRDLKHIADAYAVLIVDATHKVRDGSITFEAARKSVGQAEALIKEKWASYLATKLVDEERQLVKVLESQLALGAAAVAELNRHLAAGDRAAIGDFAEKRLYPAIDPISESFGKLIEVQLDVSRRDYEQHHAAYERTRLFVLLLLILGSIGAFAGAAWLIGRNILQPIEAARKAALDIADGNLTRSIEQGTQDEIGELLGALAMMQDNLRKLVGEIRNTAENLDNSSGQMLRATDQINQASARQSESSAAMAAAVEELTVSIHQVSDNAGVAHETADRSGTSASQGADVVLRMNEDIRMIASNMNETASAVSNLGAMSNEIGSIIGVIRDIADQTNLLALNAAIEAARAGEQGRGFAVVADEVRKLAERTTQSTTAISQIVTKVAQQTTIAVSSMEAQVQRVRDSDALARQAEESIRNITEESARVLGAVNDISSALREQAQASNDIAVNVEHIAQMSQENQNSTEETAVVADQLKALSEELTKLTRRFAL